MKKTETNYTFWIVSAVIILSLFFLLQPKIQAKIIPFLSESRLQAFIETLKKTNTIDPQTFWEFREFYDPGQALFRKEGLSENLVPDKLSSLAPKTFHPYLSFISDKTASIDGLGSKDTFNQIASKLRLEKGIEIVSESDTHLLIKRNSTYYLIFIQPAESLQNTSGIFQYWAAQGDEDQSWINITVIDQ